MTQLQENIYKQEYDRLMNQPVNQITKLELEHLREYFRINGTPETEKEIASLEQAIQADEDEIDLYEIFQYGLNADGDWTKILNDFYVEYEEHSNPNLIQLKANHILRLLEQDEEKKIAECMDYLEKSVSNQIVRAFKSLAYQLDINTGSRILMNYFHLYRSFHCVKQRYMTDFLYLGYQSKETYYYPEQFQLLSNYTTTHQVIPEYQLTKELLNGETDRVIAEINGYANKYGVRLNDTKFRPNYLYILKTAIKQEAKLRMDCNTVANTIYLFCESVTLHLGPDMFGSDKIPQEVEIYRSNSDMVTIGCALTDVFVSL